MKPPVLQPPPFIYRRSPQWALGLEAAPSVLQRGQESHFKATHLKEPRKAWRWPELAHITDYLLLLQPYQHFPSFLFVPFLLRGCGSSRTFGIHPRDFRVRSDRRLALRNVSAFHLPTPPVCLQSGSWRSDQGPLWSGERVLREALWHLGAHGRRALAASAALQPGAEPQLRLQRWGCSDGMATRSTPLRPSAGRSAFLSPLCPQRCGAEPRAPPHRHKPLAPGEMKERRGGREKEQEETPKGQGASSAMQRRLDLPELRFPAKRHQLEHFLTRPRVWFSRVKRWDAPWSLICLSLFLPLSLALSQNPASLHISTTFPSKKLQDGNAGLGKPHCLPVTKSLPKCLQLGFFPKPHYHPPWRMLSKFGGEWPRHCWSPRLTQHNEPGAVRDAEITRQSYPEQTCRPLMLRAS